MEYNGIYRHLLLISSNVLYITRKINLIVLPPVRTYLKIYSVRDIVKALKVIIHEHSIGPDRISAFLVNYFATVLTTPQLFRIFSKTFVQHQSTKKAITLN